MSTGSKYRVEEIVPYFELAVWTLHDFSRLLWIGFLIA